MTPIVRLLEATAPLVEGLQGPERRLWVRRLKGVGATGLLFSSIERAALDGGVARSLGLVVAVWSNVQEDELSRVTVALARGPLLLVLRPTGAVAQTRRWLERLATLREPWLRVAAAPEAMCHLRGFKADVRVALHQRTPSTASKTEACGSCADADRCLGVVEGAEASPADAAVSNQFDLVSEERWPLVSPDPVREALEIAAGARESSAIALAVDVIDVIVGAELWRCRSDNQGWSAAERSHVIGELGQVWLDTSSKARLDDFEHDLQPLRPVEAVDGPQMTLWQVHDDNPFERAERLVFEALKQAKGVVLDIGAGPVRYVSLLRAAMDTGDVCYVAVEPDAEAITRSRATLPSGHFVEGVGEALPLADASADHVLMLRSFNHLRDVDRAMSEAARVCRPGGTFVLIDNVAFALLRTREQLAAARAISVDETPFEHFRNANADEAVAALERQGSWELQEVHQVRPGTANQWFVRAIRRNP